MIILKPHGYLLFLLSFECRNCRLRANGEYGSPYFCVIAPFLSFRICSRFDERQRLPRGNALNTGYCLRKLI